MRTIVEHRKGPVIALLNIVAHVVTKQTGTPPVVRRAFLIDATYRATLRAHCFVPSLLSVYHGRSDPGYTVKSDVRVCRLYRPYAHGH
jgi:hypothetical protein